jgi:hypothetical protein
VGAREFGKWMLDADKLAGSRAEAIYGAEKKQPTGSEG